MNPDLLRARPLLIEDHGPTAETLRAIGFSRISHAGNTELAFQMLEERLAASAIRMCRYPTTSSVPKNKWIVPPKS